jgi:membrane-bound lytic murein transglycosylase MltF
MIKNYSKSSKWIFAFLFLNLMGLFLVLPAAGTQELNQELNQELAARMNKVWLGDYDKMVERRLIRALVPYSKTFYFLDGAEPKGATYEMVKFFEKELNEKLKTRHLKIHIAVISTPRDQLISRLAEGRGDIAAGYLTITPDGLEQVDFSNPLLTGVSEILVTGPSAPQVKNKQDLSGLEIHVQKSSSYYQSLMALNAELAKDGKDKVNIHLANEYLEDEDLLEMLNAGLIPAVVVDSHKAKFWAQIFDNITLHSTITFRENAKIAWAIRKNSPGLMAAVNGFVKKNKKGSLMGNIIFNRYLKKVGYVKSSRNEAQQKRFEEALDLFKKYGDQYKFDWLMLAALAFQESGIDQSKKSHVGAVGVMQVMPATAKDKNVGIPNIDEIEANIHAGTKYLRFMMDRYFDDPEINTLNRGLFSFAAYNAGPAKVSKLRKEAAKMGLDPNVWFHNVEIVAAKRIGRETVQYVSNIFKYYLAYRYIAERNNSKKGKE